MEAPAEFARIALRLIQGPVYDDDPRNWTELEQHQTAVRNYLARIGIEVVINEKEGYAYLTQDVPELVDEKLPRIIRRRPLNYEVTLLCVVLYQKLLEFDARDMDSRKLFLTKGQIREEVELLFPERNDQSKLLEKIDSYIKAVLDLGYLERVRANEMATEPEERYHVRRILKARFPGDSLQQILNRINPPENDDESPASEDIQ
ncbi:MAG: DUF4194 domain-containing protein [Bacteroidota bacterium]